MKYITIALNTLRSLTRPFPLRDWYIVLGVSVVLMLVLVFLAIHFFFGIRSGSIASGAPQGEGAVPSLSRESLLSTVSTYETRRVNYESGNIRIPNMIDPSR